MESNAQQLVAQFFKKYPLKKYPAGEVLLQAGDKPLYIYYVIHGQVKQVEVTKSGSELVLNVYHKPAFFPIMIALENAQNVYRLEAVEDTLIQRAPIADVVAWLKTEPEVTFDLLMRIQYGIQGLLRRMAYAMSGTAQEKLISELLINGERFGVPYKDGFILKLSVNEIATRCGMARETASRELSKLKDRDLVELKNGALVVSDKSALAILLS
ncbi:MAG: Crp/Fnr family transcriptional regulator [bacterium]